MTKSEFVELVQKKGEFNSKTAAENAIKAFTDSITELLKNRDNLALVGFGTFSTAKVAAKSGTLPGTDKKYNKPAHVVPKFKFSKGVKDSLILHHVNDVDSSSTALR